MSTTDFIVTSIILAICLMFPGDEVVPPMVELKCSFCLKTQRQVKTLMAGEDAHICNECVDLCGDICNTSGDKLYAMWEQQEEFMKLLQRERGFPEFPTDITSKKGQQFLEGISFHMMKELFEAGQHLKNSKSHRATEIVEVDREAYKEELVDALHLFFEVCIAAGISVTELFEAYMKKGTVNEQRIKNGY